MGVHLFRQPQIPAGHRRGLPTWWPVSRSVPRRCSASYCGRSSPGNDRHRWSAAWNNSAGMLVVEAVGVRFFAPGTTPEMPLRAATCREAQDGHRPCEAAGRLFGAGGFVISTRASVTLCASELAWNHPGERYPPFPRQWKPPNPAACDHLKASSNALSLWISVGRGGRRHRRSCRCACL